MSIIAISGKKGVGKDVVGKIIQYLTSESNIYPFDLKLDYSYRSNWQIKKSVPVVANLSVWFRKQCRLSS